MKKIIFLIVCVCASADLVSSAHELAELVPAKAGLSEIKLVEVNQFMEGQVANQKIAGRIVIVSQDRKIGFFHSYGLMDREANKPMTSDTIFRIYSMSKAITIRDLMLHISGLTHGDGPDGLKEAYARLKPMQAPTLAEMVERLSQVPLAFDPESNWNYGVSIDVLGRVIEVVSGKSLDVFLNEVIFRPLDLKDTASACPRKNSDASPSIIRGPTAL